MHQTNQVRPSWVWRYVKAGGMVGLKWCGGRVWHTMGVTGGYRYKTTPLKFAMERVLGKAMCVRTKTEPGHFPICLPYNSLWWCQAVHWHISRVFYCCGYGQWVLASSGRRVGAINTDILHPWWKLSVESDAYGGPKCSSNISGNDYEATNGMEL